MQNQLISRVIITLLALAGVAIILYTALEVSILGCEGRFCGEASDGVVVYDREPFEEGLKEGLLFSLNLLGAAFMVSTLAAGLVAIQGSGLLPVVLAIALTGANLLNFYDYLQDQFNERGRDLVLDNGWAYIAAGGGLIFIAGVINAVVQSNRFPSPVPGSPYLPPAPPKAAPQINAVRFIAIIGLAVYLVGVFMPISCEEGECDFETAPQFSFDRFDEADDFREGLVGNTPGTSSLAMGAALLLAIIIFKGVSALLLATIAYQANLFYLTIEDTSVSLGWGWVVIFAGLGIMGLAVLGYIINRRQGPAYMPYGAPPPYPPYPPPYPPYGAPPVPPANP